jgi:cell division inhibitor SepF
VGSLHRAGVWLGLADDREEELDPDADVYHDDDPAEPDDRWSKRRTSADLRMMRRPQPAVDGVAATGTHPQQAAGARSGKFEIATVHAHSFHDARTIGEYYRQDIPVVIDLSGLDDSDARRIVDFSAGLIFGRRGDLHRLTRGVFLLSPPGVAILAGGRSQPTGGDFFDQT